MAEECRLEVTLFDTSGEDDVNINQTLQEMAEAEAPPQLPPVSVSRELGAEGGAVQPIAAAVSRDERYEQHFWWLSCVIVLGGVRVRMDCWCKKRRHRVPSDDRVKINTL